MRVLHVIPSISSKRGGPSKAVVDMVKALRLEGIDASILTTTDNIDYQEVSYPEGVWFEYQDVPVLMYSCVGSCFHQLREFLISPGLTTWLLRNITNYDLVHIHAIFSYPSTVAMLIARLKNVPYIIRTIGQLSPWSLRQNYWVKQIMLLSVEKSNIEASIAIHVTSKSEEEDVKKLLFKSDILNLELGINMPRSRGNFSSQIRTGKTIFLFLSRLHPKKQLENLLEAFFIVREKHNRNDWLLYIAGDGEPSYVKQLHDLAKELGLNGKIEWLGHVTGYRKEKIFAESDWFVLPSANENFGISAVEALASGVPVILTKHVGIADLVSKYRAGILASESPEELSDTLVKAIARPTDQMKHSALLLVSDIFSWKKVIHQLICFYTESLLKEKV